MEITRSNFEDRFDLIKESLRDCEFLAIDTEFSGKFVQVYKNEIKYTQFVLFISLYFSSISYLS